MPMSIVVSFTIKARLIFFSSSNTNSEIFVVELSSWVEIWLHAKKAFGYPGIGLKESLGLSGMVGGSRANYIVNPI